MNEDTLIVPTATITQEEAIAMFPPNDAAPIEVLPTASLKQDEPVGEPAQGPLTITPEPEQGATSVAVEVPHQGEIKAQPTSGSGR